MKQKLCQVPGSIQKYVDKKHLGTTVKHHRPREILKAPERKNRLTVKECQLDWQHTFLKQPESN